MNCEQTKTAVPYPLFIRLEGQDIVVVGAGAVAARKVKTLLDYGARVLVIAPQACSDLIALADEGCIVWRRREYRKGDLEGSLLCVVATGLREVDESVYREARAAHIPVNVVDVPELCTFIAPSIMRRGQLQVAVSTNGAAPGVSRTIRQELEGRFGDWWTEYIDCLAEVRSLVKERVAGPARVRTPIFEALGSACLEDRFAAGEHPSAEAVYEEIVVPLLEEARS